GRELLCRKWWPDGAALTATQTDVMLADIQRAEWMRRENAMRDAIWDVASHTGGESQRKATRAYARAHERQWPMWIACVETGEVSPRYHGVRVLVLTELSRPGLCVACGGRGNVTPDIGAVHACTDCRGTGRRRISDRARAKVIGITEGGYRHTWRPVYEWTMRTCEDALVTAERQLAAACR